MRILRPQTHVVRRRASSPVFRRISGSAPMMIALTRIAAVFVKRTRNLSAHFPGKFVAHQPFW